MDGETPRIRLLQEGILQIGVKNEDGLGVIIPQFVQRQLRKRIGGIRGQVTPFDGEGVPCATRFQNEPDALVAELTTSSVRMAVWRDLDGSQVRHEVVCTNFMRQNRFCASLGVTFKMVRCRAIPVNCGDSGFRDMLVICQEVLAKVGDRDRRKCYQAVRRPGCHLCVDLGATCSASGRVRATLRRICLPASR